MEINRQKVAGSGDSASLHAPANSAIASSSHPSNDIGIFNPHLLRMSGCTISMDNKTNGELAMKRLEDVSSEEITARMKMLRHVNVSGVGLYIDGSESWELMRELARLKANSIAVRYNNWLLTSSECQASTLPLIPRSRIPCTFIPAADGAFFGSLMLKKSFYVHNKDLCSASLVYSREGWLMFLSAPNRRERERTLFLMNPSTGEMLTLPPAPRIGCVRNHKAAFTIHNNRPDLVIFPCLNGRYIRILLARPGDEKWEEYTTRVISKHVGLWDSLLCARRIYCFFDHGNILMVFHLDGKYWSTYEENIDVGLYLLEFEGRFLTVDPPLSHVLDGDKGFIVRELIICQDKASLVRLDDIELSNKSWFLGPKQSFCARIMGQKVYRFRMAPNVEAKEEWNLHCVYYHDLLKKKFGVLTPDAFNDGHGWVDLGGVLTVRYPRA